MSLGALGFSGLASAYTLRVDPAIVPARATEINGITK
jgi:hypothetical protein